MAQIGNVPEIVEVKEKLEIMKQEGLVADWELPYENLLTRRSAAIFFLTPVDESQLEEIWACLKQYNHFRQRLNIEKKLSELTYRIEFNEEDHTS